MTIFEGRWLNQSQKNIMINCVGNPCWKFGGNQSELIHKPNRLLLFSYWHASAILGCTYICMTKATNRLPNPMNQPKKGRKCHTYIDNGWLVVCNARKKENGGGGPTDD